MNDHRAIFRLLTRPVGAVAIAVAVALSVSSCADDASASIPVLRVNAAEYAFELPDEVRAGPTRISVTNDGDEEHHAQLFKLNDGATVADLGAALATGDPAAALEFGRFEGGTALVAPGETSNADPVVEFTAGDYGFICFVEDPAGVPHLAHGMLQPFVVTEASDPPPMPTADIDVELVDYGFSLPATIPGDAVLNVTNTAAAEPHEMVIARLDDGATATDVGDALDHGAAMPATPVGGMQAILPGTSQFLQLDLQPGTYVVICHVSSPDGTPHHTKGMIEEVTVT